MNKAHFHHIHLNVSDIDKSLAFYQKFFGAKKIKFRDKSNALFTEKSFFLFDEVQVPPQSHVGSSLWHIGWSGVDGPSEFNWRVDEGIEVHTPINPLNKDHWMYFLGPDREVVEVFTGNRNNTFEHVHLLASNVDETMEWFKSNLGLDPEFEKAQTWATGLFQWNRLHVGNINITVNGRPVEERTWFPAEFKPTKGTSLDHLAFSFENLEYAFEQMLSSQVHIIRGIETDLKHGLKSFFVMGPDKLLIEVVEEKPIPEGIWL